jgi:NAD(P)-dependent dehydrogenase (short-subunit alcohol dehydrogenase family)
MSTLPGKTVLITGANAGIGKDVARQLALRPDMARIYLACRNKDRATTAKAELEAKTGRPSSTSFSWTSPIRARSAPALRPSTDPSTRWS